MHSSSLRELLERNAQHTHNFYGVAVMPATPFDPDTPPMMSIASPSSAASEVDGGKDAFVRALQVRAHTLWRALYPRTAPPSITNLASPTNAESTEIPVDGRRDAVRQGILTVVGGSKFSVAGSDDHTAASYPSALTFSQKRGRDADDILSMDPAQLKARSALIVSQAAAEEAEAQQYKPPPKWKLAKVLVGHQGWVWTTAVEPGNKWFATGGFDAIIKVWDLETGALKMNLTGHKEAVRSIALSKVSPYMFSGSDDHSVKCWDLERNEVVREFFGHKSAVHCVAAHPSLDVVISGGRDKTVRVFDLRTRAVVHTMSGHTDSVMSLVVQQEEPQVISGGSDGFIYLWDLASGRAVTRLTRHKKPVRGLALTPSRGTLISCGADEVRVWKMSSGEFVTNAGTRVQDGQQRGSKSGAMEGEEEELAYRWSCCAMSPHNVLAVGSQDGELAFYDWNRPQPKRVTGQHFAPYQFTKTKSLPGTLNGEGGINGMAYDVSGTRLITTESDKSVKIWRLRDGRADLCVSDAV